LKSLYIIFIALLLNSCATKEELIPKTALKTKKVEIQKEYIEDLKLIPQDVSFYTQNVQTTDMGSQVEYEKSYFRVWNINRSNLSVDDAMWAHKIYKVGNTYGENLQLLEQSFFDNALENANYENYLSVSKKALSLNLLNIRAFPTNKVILRDPRKAGEGFPFDYLQNSTISANKPLLISHYSKDREWVFVVSSFAYGWVKSSEVVVIDERYTKLWQQAKQIFITKDTVPIYSQNDEFLFHSRVGMMLPLIDEDKESYTVLTVTKYKENRPLYLKSKISKDIAHKGKLSFNASNIEKIINELSQSHYGWGGMYAQRDCSSTLRDFYAPFGIWLPRNSYQQSLVGEVINLNNLSDKEKLASIKKSAVAFRTLVYKKGHIGLYVGTIKNEVIIYQNVWGVKTKKDGVEGRFIIGKPIFSTLEVGSNLSDYDKDASMLHKLKSISTL